MKEFRAMKGKATICIKRLESGYLRAQGSGPCEWAQWPESQSLPNDSDFFPEASSSFRRDLLQLLEKIDFKLMQELYSCAVCKYGRPELEGWRKENS